MSYFLQDYPAIPPEVLRDDADPAAMRAALVELYARSSPSRGRWEYLVQEYTDDPETGAVLRKEVRTGLAEGAVRYGFGHVKDHGATYYCAVEHPREVHEMVRNRAPGIRRRIAELSPPLVGLAILIKSTRRFQEIVARHGVEDPFGIYSVNLDAYSIPEDINFGTTLSDIDTGKALYLVEERLPSFGVRVDPLADLAIHVLSIESVNYLLDEYRAGPGVLLHKPVEDIGNVRLLNVGSLPELEAQIKGHPWFGTNGTNERRIEPLLPLE